MESLWKDLSCNLKQASKAVLVQTENAGRGLVATENIQRDDVILTETPVISGPPQSVGPHFCANCSQPLTDGLLEGMFIITIIFKLKPCLLKLLVICHVLLFCFAHF